MSIFSNLNNNEFEVFCKDVLARKLGISLRTFAAGRDGGIDITDGKRKYIAQVKHYEHTAFSKLYTNLLKEKLKELKPEQYFVCCSNELTPANIEQIYAIFADYMQSRDNILTGIELKDFICDEKNADILRKHYKLCLLSSSLITNMLCGDIALDSEYCLELSESEFQRFVKTTAYDESLKILESNHALFITGGPGVGKSMTSRMLVLNFKIQDYKVCYTTTVEDIQHIKREVVSNPSLKQIILLDDCLGQAYFDMNSLRGRELAALVSHVIRNSNKKIILNSRVTILNEAKKKDLELLKLFEDNDCQVHVIDMNRVNYLEKARILYNHLYFTDIPSAHFRSLLQDNGYLSIVKHKNYNPRIVEFVTKKNQYKQILPENYLDFILGHLDNPQQVWADEYEYKLQPADRLLLQTIHSLTDVSVSFQYVEACYNAVLEKVVAIDTTKANFTDALSRLAESFVSIVDKSGIKMLSMINPSVNDYLDFRFKNDLAERSARNKRICSIDQILRLDKENLAQRMEELFVTGEILDFVFESEEKKCHCIVAFVGRLGNARNFL